MRPSEGKGNVNALTHEMSSEFTIWGSQILPDSDPTTRGLHCKYIARVEDCPKRITLGRVPDIVDDRCR